mgnify:CR=1 FL=1
MSGPLTGIRVVDLTRVLAGPFCAMVLADLGAEVIKIERPITGDDSRAYPPFQNQTSAYFVSVNRGKKSVTMDLKDPDAKEVLLRLVEKSDIFIENFKPGVADRLGLSYEELEKVNPRIIYGSRCGYGQTGPYRNKASYDIIIQGMSGMMSITGPDPDHPTKVGSSIADIVTGYRTRHAGSARVIGVEGRRRGPRTPEGNSAAYAGNLRQILDRILRHGVDRVTSSIVMLMSVHRGSRDEAVACKGKRQAKAHEASEERHVFRLEANCCRLLNSNFYTRKAPAGIAFAQQTQHFTPSCGVPFG